ncbi:MAG: pentapeptide repeat-containing protein [Geminicoccaceae bacterium]
MVHELRLKLLKKGVEVWNRYRAEEEFFNPDFTGADLSGMKLVEANMAVSDFTNATLSNADLRAARLQGSHFTRTNLRDTLLGGTDFERAHLDGADFTDAQIWNAHFLDEDLSASIGLETCRHRSASSVDQHTLLHSKNVPPIFLAQL